MNLEGFASIPGFDGAYEIDRCGRVYSNVTHSFKRTHVLASTGKMAVYLSKNNKQHAYSIHMLVATTFIPKKPGDFRVRHKDGNVTNNCVENLEWYGFNETDNPNPITKRYGSTKKVIVKCPTGDTLTFNSEIACSKCFGHEKSWLSTSIKRYGNPFVYKGYEIILKVREVMPKS